MAQWGPPRARRDARAALARWEQQNQHRTRGWRQDHMEEGEIARRQLNVREFIEKIEHIEHEGLPVRLRFVDIPEDRFDIFDPRAPDQLLLAIYTDPLEGFEQLMREGIVFEGAVPYHLSLCFAPELRRFNLYDSDNGIMKGLAAFGRLRRLYDGRRARLIVRIQNTAAYIESVEVEGVASDLSRDADFNALHEAGSYYDRPHHISM